MIRAQETSLRELLSLTWQTWRPVFARIEIYLSERRMDKWYRHLEHFDRDAKEIERSKAWVSNRIINETALQQDLRRRVR